MGVRKKRIGLLIDYLVSEYCENLVDGISSYCKDNDIELLLFVIGEIYSSAPKTYNYQYVATTAHIREANVDGFVIVSGTQMHTMSQKEFLSYLRSYKSLPIVNISMELPDIPSIIVDCTQAFSSMIQYLITEQKCRKFALMGVDSKSYDVKTRTRIFKEVLRKNEISVKNTVFWKSNFEYERTYQILQDYHKKGKTFDFDAIVALNDNMAFACMDFCQKQLGLKVPDDIIITGFDDINRASFFTPSLTTITALGYSPCVSELDGIPITQHSCTSGCLKMTFSIAKGHTLCPSGLIIIFFILASINMLPSGEIYPLSFV